MSALHEYLIIWNNRFPYDHQYRKKYNIAFGSKEHRSLNQIDIYFDCLEDKIYQKYAEEYIEEKENKADYEKTGEWLKFHELSEKKFDDLFNSLDVTKMQKK